MTNGGAHCLKWHDGGVCRGSKVINVDRYPWVSLETDKRWVSCLVGQVDDKYHMSVSLLLRSNVVDSVSGTGNEVTVSVSGVTLDDDKNWLLIFLFSLEVRTIDKNDSSYIDLMNSGNNLPNFTSEVELSFKFMQ